MRRRLEPLLRRLWRGEARGWQGLLDAALVPAELAYRIGVRLRNWAYDRGILPATTPPLPTVSVGNVLVGGTGKTPVSAWVARTLADRERAPALVSRGYGGDEVRLHRRWNPDVPVLADRDRLRAAHHAAGSRSRCVVLDDGFQHRRIGRSLDLVLHPVESAGRTRLLPRGPYRDPPSAMARADWIVLTRRTAGEAEAQRVERRLRHRFPDVRVARIRLVPGGWTTLRGTAASPPVGPGLVALTGIARPESFATLAERLTGSEVELVRFADHHAFTPDELSAVRRKAGDRPIVLTEKDAVRIDPPSRLPPSTRVLRLEVEVETGEAELLQALLDVTASAVSPPPTETEADSVPEAPRPRATPGRGET